MKLLIKRYSSDANWCDDIDYGYIDLTPELAGEILDRIRLVRRLREQAETAGRQPRALIFKDIYADFIDIDDETDEFYQIVRAEGAYELPEDFVLDEERIHSTELDEMRIEDDEVSWRATIKHTDIIVETKGLPVELLEKISGKKL
jgi:hypothetical protein